ncbi:MAG: hypothetical protein ACR2GY_10215 [Phycisphaerales bacterium]
MTTHPANTSRTLLGPLGISMGAILICVIVVLLNLAPVLSTLFTTAPSEEDHQARIAKLSRDHQIELATYRDRFEGRSPFFVPPAPPPVRGPDPEPPPPPVQRDMGAASAYAGPLTAPQLLADRVLFRNGSSTVGLLPGQSISGVRVVKVTPPVSVTVAWTAPSTPTAKYTEGEYDLPISRAGGSSFISLSPPDFSTLPSGLTAERSNDPDAAYNEEEDDAQFDEAYDDEEMPYDNGQMGGSPTGQPGGLGVPSRALEPNPDHDPEQEIPSQDDSEQQQQPSEDDDANPEEMDEAKDTDGDSDDESEVVDDDADDELQTDQSQELQDADTDGDGVPDQPDQESDPGD